MEAEIYRLVKKAIKGNKNAFEKLVQHHFERIYRTAYLYVHNEADALDIVQEATYQAYKSINSLRNPEYFTTLAHQDCDSMFGTCDKEKGQCHSFE